MSVLSRLSRTFTGRSIGANLGRVVGTVYGGPIGGMTGEQFGDTVSTELSRLQDRAETTQTQTTPSDMGPTMPMGPATNIEIDFRGESGMPIVGRDMGGTFTGFQNASFQQANVLPFIRPGAGAIGGLVGGAAALIMDLVTGQPTKLVITRKLQRDAKMAADFYMNDLDMVAEYLSRTKRKRFTEDIVVDILLKKFTNQGPYVTKAAVRKTRSTMRKLKTLNKLEAELCKPTRRAPARRTSRAMATATAR